MSMLLSLLLLGPILFYAAYTCLMTWAYLRIPGAEIPLPSEIVFLSVIIPARNEEEHLEKCIRSVCQQSLSPNQYEVLCLNDHSTDTTLQILSGLTGEFPNLRVINMADYPGHSQKKQAIALGVSLSKGDIIIQTDADCWVGREWLTSLLSYFTPRTGMVSGPVLLEEGRGMLSIFQTMEYMGLSVLGAGAIQLGFPTMCNGANLAYRKSAFLQVGGFQGVDHIASGDDELLMQKINLQTDWDIAFARDRRAIVHTYALASWKALKAQRLRWVSKARAYLDRRINVVQLIFLLAFISLPVLIWLSLYQREGWGILLGWFLLKSIPDLWILFTAAKFFHKLPLLKYFPLLQPVYIVYVIWVGIAGNRVNAYNWKGRKVS
ncbi:MAG: glycosyltransferase [Bacteroidota bacterium]